MTTMQNNKTQVPGALSHPENLPTNPAWKRGQAKRPSELVSDATVIKWLRDMLLIREFEKIKAG